MKHCWVVCKLQLPSQLGRQGCPPRSLAAGSHLAGLEWMPVLLPRNPKRMFPGLDGHDSKPELPTRARGHDYLGVEESTREDRRSLSMLLIKVFKKLPKTTYHALQTCTPSARLLTPLFVGKKIPRWRGRDGGESLSGGVSNMHPCQETQTTRHGLSTPTRRVGGTVKCL